MPRPSAEAVSAAIRHCRSLRLRTEQGSAVESYLTSRRLVRLGLKPTVRNTDQVTAAMFGLLPRDRKGGRAYLFRAQWGALDGTGRRTVWNTTTRGETVARSLFRSATRPDGSVQPDYRGGLTQTAAADLGKILGTARPSWEALAVILLREVDVDNESDLKTKFLDYLGTRDANDRGLPMPTSDLAAFTTTDPLGVPLLAASSDDEFVPDRLDADLLPGVTAVQPALASEALQGVTLDLEDVVVDPRVERMLEIAVRTYRAVLLVGPPGSGKNVLLKRLVAKAQCDPELFGLSTAPQLPLTRTPDESWTSFELIGGYAPVAEGLRYASGAVLDAIGNDQWLLLDETNRADMDKIFGALLTWLSMDAVVLGPLTPEGKTQVVLDWNLATPESIVDPAEGLATTDDPHLVTFSAGKDWRLLGTYNPQDAQRVFRFGVALSRRFAIVPIPPLDPDRFDELLEFRENAAEVVWPGDLRVRLSNLYRAHYNDPVTQLGPAIFLRMAEYVLSAAAIHDAEVSDEQLGIPHTLPLDELMAEAYLVRVGKYLSTYDTDSLLALGARVTGAALPGLSVTQWEWASENRSHVG